MTAQRSVEPLPRTRSWRRHVRETVIARRRRLFLILWDGMSTLFAKPGRFSKYNGACSCGLCDVHKQSCNEKYYETQAVRRGASQGEIAAALGDEPARGAGARPGARFRSS